MADETVVYNRNTLYAQVWAEPMLKLAKVYGLSDVGLRKICRRLRVPCPTRGYWGRGRADRVATPPPLPPLRQGEPEEIVDQRDAKLPVDPEQHAEAEARIAFEMARENTIRVEEVLTSPHPLVARAQKSLKAAKPLENGVLRPAASQCLDIRVSQDSMDRALRISDALVKALEARGFPVSVGQGEKHATQVKVLGEVLEFQLQEKLDRSVRELTARELKEREKYPWSYATRQSIYSSSGRLELSMDGVARGGLRRRWRDSPGRRLEECLNKFIISLLRGAVQRRADLMERERREREYQEEVRRREEERLRQEAAKRRAEILDDRLACWQKSLQIRAFLAARFPTPSSGEVSPLPSPGLARWVEWARGYADRLEAWTVNFPDFEERQPTW